MLIGHWGIFFGERAIHRWSFCPFSNWIVILLLKEFFLYFGHKSLITSMICNHCHLFGGFFFSFTFLTTSFEAQIVVVLVKFDLSVFVTKIFCVISKKPFLIPGPFDQLKCESLSHVQLSGSPWTTAHQAPPSMELSR